MKSFPLVVSLCLLLQAAPVPLTPTLSEIVWDPVTVDVNGAAATPAKYEVAVSLRTVDVAAGGAALKSVQVTAAKVDRTGCVALFSGLALGEYRVWVRAVSTGGTNGFWSDPLLVQLQPAAVVFPKVTGLRVIDLPAGSGVLVIVPPGGTP